KNKRQLAEGKVKVGRNDPCPCGSGKKYKKCCLGKEEVTGVYAEVDYLETIEEQEKWLEDYPVLDQERKQGEVRLSDIFDNESIEIDRLVYLALHHRAIPVWGKRDRVKEERIKVNYLQQAFDKFLAKCEKENINSFDVYDDKYKIHYRSNEWVKTLSSKIENKEIGTINNSLAERVSEVVLRF